LSGAERQAISVQPTTNIKAHELYLKGRHLWRNFFAPGYEKIRDYFQQVVDLDPSYALAYAGLGLYYSFGACNGILPPDVWPEAETAVNKALELDETLGEAINAGAGVELYYKRNWPAAERAFHRGAELNPNFADIAAHYGLCLTLFGRNQEALEQLERAAELDPFFPGSNLHRGRMFFFMRDYDRARSQFAKTLELHPGYTAAHEWFGDACQMSGMPAEAIIQWRAALALSGQPEQARLLEETFGASGFDAAVRALAGKQLEQLQEKTARGEHVPAYHYMMAYMRLGDTEQAFSWMKKTVEEPSWFALQLRVNPLLDPLRSDPRFAALVSQVFSKSR
jgi:tetratricopeptide (TPR) repeat protein